MITLDTSALFALINRGDPDHEAVRVALVADRGPYLVPAGILAEIGYLLEQRLPLAVAPFLSDLRSGAFALDCGAEGLGRVQQLVERYADLPLGIADASVIACAEHNGGRVLTLDRRHFGVVAREGSIVLLPG